MSKTILPVLGAALFCSTAFAANNGGEISAGYLGTTGNSKTTNLNARIDLHHISEKWVDTLQLKAVNSSEHGDTTAERYDVDGKEEYNLTEQNYLFDEAEYTKDLFGGIRQRIEDTAGYGRRLLDTSRQTLDVQVGAGVRHDTTQKPELKRHTDPVGTGGLEYKLHITDNSDFSEKAKVVGGESNVHFESETALDLRLYKALYVELSYTLDHNTQVPSGKKKTDTYTAVNVAYKFGGKPK